VSYDRNRMQAKHKLHYQICTRHVLCSVCALLRNLLQFANLVSKNGMLYNAGEMSDFFVMKMSF